MPETQNQSGFQALNVPTGLQNKIKALGIHTPTPIQTEAIPVALTGKDLVGIAQTGTGKTLAFGLPIMARLQPRETALILAPTRELAEQIRDTLRQLGAQTACLIGGAAMGPQLHDLRKHPNVIIATPGRLIDHLDRRSVSLRNVAIVVLDEADRMLDMGFANAIERIIAQTPSQRQTMLFSATMPDEIAGLSQRYLKHPHKIEIAKEFAPDLVSQELVVVPQEGKSEMLGDLIEEHKGSVLVFARTRHGARKLAKFVRTSGHTAAELHSDRTMAQRREALAGFKRGCYRILVATDIAARGIDVKEIGLVINYDVPEKPEDYIHRIGRTGRAGATGRAITLATPEQHKDVRDIERLLRSPIAVSKRTALTLPTLRHSSNPAIKQSSNTRPQRGRGYRGRNTPYSRRSR